MGVERFNREPLSSNLTVTYPAGTIPPVERLRQFVSSVRSEDAFKRDKSRQLFRISSKIGTLVIKHYDPPGSQRWEERLESWVPWRTSYAVNELANALEIRRRGFRTVQPVAALEWSNTFRTTRSLFVSLEETGTRLDNVLGQVQSHDQLMSLVKQPLNQLKAMHEQGICFGSTQPRNIIRKDDGTLVWLDFERTKIDRTFTTGRMTDLRRFIRRLSKDMPGELLTGTFLEDLFAILREEHSLSLPMRYALCLGLSQRVSRLSFPDLAKHYGLF